MNSHWYEIFNTSRMIFFIFGIMLATGWHYRKLKRKGIILDLTPLGIMTGVAVIIFIAVQQVGLSTEVKQCQAEFNHVLKERATLSDQSDELAGKELDANTHWLATLTSPPKEIAALHTTDPIYQSWVRSTIKDYIMQVNKIRDERTKSLEERREQTYPTPTCNK